MHERKIVGQLTGLELRKFRELRADENAVNGTFAAATHNHTAAIRSIGECADAMWEEIRGRLELKNFRKLTIDHETGEIFPE